METLSEKSLNKLNWHGVNLSGGFCGWLIYENIYKHQNQLFAQDGCLHQHTAQCDTNKFWIFKKAKLDTVSADQPHSNENGCWPCAKLFTMCTFSLPVSDGHTTYKFIPSCCSVLICIACMYGWNTIKISCYRAFLVKIIKIHFPL